MPRKSLILPVLALVLLSGCRTGNVALEKQNAEILAELKRINARLDDVEKQSKQNAEIRPELKKINANLDRLEKQMKQIQINRATPPVFGPTPAIRNKLSKIRPLPANPTDQQIIDYIRQIREASEGQPGYSSHDPQVALYERIGPGHLHLLFHFLKNDGHHSPLHLMAALPKLVGEADKELVRRSLKQYPMLIRGVVSNGWLKEMKKDILALLAQPKEANLPVYELSKYIGDLVQSPDDLKIITDAYIYNRNGFVLLDGLKKLPGVDIRQLVNQAWAEAQKNPVYENAMISRALNVIRDGGPNIEAVKYLLKLLMISDNPGSQNYRTHVVVPFLSARCDFPIYDPTRLREWYDKNADRIVYDPAKGKYVLKK
ncbi:MAG: hypothetical protein J5806_12915 [Lentisphaeria bacterium]|nr:hypothetical protein [Lentisphaeria bacterium]